MDVENIVNKNNKYKYISNSYKYHDVFVMRLKIVLKVWLNHSGTVTALMGCDWLKRKKNTEKYRSI